ncbi:MAG: type IV pilin N-terminal domain-containing protein [Methanomassiliicoccales archaeon]|nr:MAG: type IV pilin N-terminal domain-containing protein [Methanomassiliicoccales archaeon]
MRCGPKGRHKRSKSAVSDIIGNLLILGITVVLFSSVLISVMNLPGPQKQTYADFSYEQPLFYGADGGTPYVMINVTMGGGQILNNEDVIVVLFINDNPLRLTLLQGGVGPSWVTGETWRYKATGVLPDDKLEISIIDNTNNNIVWQTSLVTGVINQEYAPIITERGIVQFPLYQNSLITFYCKVVDFNSNLNLNSVYVDLSGLGLSGVKYKLTYDPGNGTFRSASGVVKADLNWNGKTVRFNATDTTNLEGFVDYTVVVFKDEKGNGTIGGGGGPPGNIDYSALQGFNIFELNDWIENAFNATPRRIFAYTESVAVVVVSKYLVNTQNENLFQVINGTTKLPYSAVSTPNVKFVPYLYVSGYYVYLATFNTTNLPYMSSYYYVTASLKDNWVPNNQFVMNDMIFVAVPGGSQTPTYPVFRTYKDSAYTIPCSDFTTYDPTNNVIYVEILNYNGNAWDPYTGDVEIRDFFWNAQLKKAPAYDATNTPLSKWNGPVSNLWQIIQQAPPGKYRFAINLNNVTDGKSWIPGKNAYALRYDMFKAGTEKSLLSKIINITAPSIKLDITIGSQPTGNARFATANALYYYENENQWYPPQLLETGSTDKKYYSPTVFLVRAGDMNGDNKTDLVAVLQDGSTDIIYLYVYYNFQSSFGGGWIKSQIAILSSIPTDIAIGNIDFDNDADVVLSYATTGILHIYRNDGAWTRTSVSLSGVQKVILADMDPAGTAGNDPSRSQDIIVSRTGGTITVLKNQFGNGVTWVQQSLSSTGTALIDFWAQAEYNVTGTVTNNYLSTTSPIQDDGVYEQIRENITYRYAQTFPTLKGPNNEVSDELVQLRYRDDIVPIESAFTVNAGSTAEVIAWDSTGLQDDLVPFKVTLKVRYMTDEAYGTTGDYLIWTNKTGAVINTIQIENTSGAWVEREFNMTPYAGTLASALTTAKLNITNTNTNGAAINFDYWWINVTWKTGDSLEHIWQFTLNPASSGNHQFQVYALRSPSIDGDNFVFYYSTSIAGPWTQITSATIGTSLPMQPYTGSIPGTVSGTVYIRVKDLGGVTTSSPDPNYIRIGQMKILTTVSSTAIGSSILAINVADMDQDGDLDILAVGMKTGNRGQAYVLYNGPGDIFLPSNIVAVSSADAQLYTARSITGGKYFSPYGKAYLDIAVCTSSKILFINQTEKSTRTYSGLLSFSFSNTYGNFMKMVGADIDGNGRDDLIAYTDSGYLLVYANYLGRQSASGWQIYVVDNLGAGMVNDVDVSKFAP